MESSSAVAVAPKEGQEKIAPKSPKVSLTRFDPARDLETLAQSTLQSKVDVEGAAVAEIDAAPTKNGLLSRLRNVVANEESREDSPRLAKRRMAILRRYAALMTGLVAHPGMEASDGEKSSVLRRLIVQTDRVASEFTRRISSGLNLDSTQWVTDMIARTAADLVAVRWYQKKDTDLSALFNEVAQVIPGGEGLDDIATFSLPEHPPMPDMQDLHNRRAAFRMTLLKNLAPIHEELMQSRLKPEAHGRWLEQIRDALLDQALTDPTLKMEYAGANVEHRVMLIQNHLGCSGKIMKMALQAENDRSEGKPNLKKVLGDWEAAMSALTATVDVEMRMGRMDSVVAIGTPKVG